jgi:hypothetical protein
MWGITRAMSLGKMERQVSLIVLIEAVSEAQNSGNQPQKEPTKLHDLPTQ